MTTPPCRLSLVFARNAPIVVVLRRGPSKMVEVVKWQTDMDQFEHGQWFYGRIYAERCGLSPNGSLFVYFTMAHGRVDTANGYKQKFTAVSRPPYLTALAMWPQDDTWGGGGRFIDDHTLRLAQNQLPEAHPQHPPRGLRIETGLDQYNHFDYAPDAGFLDHVAGGGGWIGRDHRGRRIIVRDGRILVGDSTGGETLLKDFNADTKQRVISPQWARDW